jgi:hypothetical protein
MPNPNSPFGLLPTMRGHGGAAPYTTNRVKASGTPSIYKGDVLLNTATPGVIAATATGLFCGVAVHGIATGIAGEILIYDDERQKFYGQMDAVNGGFALADGNLNALLLYGTPAVTDFTARNFKDVSNQSISGASKATTATHDIRLDVLHPTPLNEHGDYAVVEVWFNKHQNTMQTVGI